MQSFVKRLAFLITVIILLGCGSKTGNDSSDKTNTSSQNTNNISGNGSNTQSSSQNNEDQKPVLNPIGNKSVAEGTLLQFTVSASDPDGNTITLSATGIPAWASFNVTTGLLNGTPGYADSGAYNVTFTANDGSLSTSEAITITVNNANQAPILNPIGGKSVNEGSNLNFVISGYDPDGDTLTYSAVGLPTGATFTVGNRTFSWTPGYTQAGSYNVTFKVSDGLAMGSESITITVDNTNRAPILNPVGSKIVAEGSNLNFTVTGSDPDGDVLAFSTIGLPSGATFDSLSHIFNWTPAYSQVGTYTIRFTVNDGALSSSEDVTATVTLKAAKIELRNQINIKQDNLGYVHYLGELINTGDLPACFIEINIDSKDINEHLIDTDFTYVDGSPMLMIKTIMTDTCLRGEEFGGFELWTLLTELPASFSYKINWDSTDISEPLVSPSQIVIDGAITETIDYFGNKKLLGFIKNLHPSITVNFVKTTFTALNGQNVIATDFTYVNGSSCSVSSITTDTCLVPGESGSFSITFDEPPSAITDFYYKISYDY